MKVIGSGSVAITEITNLPGSPIRVPHEATLSYLTRELADQQANRVQYPRENLGLLGAQTASRHYNSLRNAVLPPQPEPHPSTLDEWDERRLAWEANLYLAQAAVMTRKMGVPIRRWARVYAHRLRRRVTRQHIVAIVLLVTTLSILTFPLWMP